MIHWPVNYYNLLYVLRIDVYSVIYILRTMCTIYYINVYVYNYKMMLIREIQNIIKKKIVIYISPN